MALSSTVQETVNRWQAYDVLLNRHQPLLELWEQDKNQGYPFFRDLSCKPEAQLHEYERFGNMNYAAQMRIWSAYKRLEAIDNLYHPEKMPYLSNPNEALPRLLFIGEDLHIAAFFADLVSALEAIAGQIILIYGLPISLGNIHWTTLVTTLSKMTAPWDKVTIRKKGHEQHYSVMSTNNLCNIVLASGKMPSWINLLIKYRNNFTHRTFFATIVDKQGFYLPKEADALPSLVINPIETARSTGNINDIYTAKSELFHSLPLHEYCRDILYKVRGLIEEVYEQIIYTYQFRLTQPNTIVNPHALYRLGLFIQD